GEKGYDHDNLRHVVITASCFALVVSTLAVGLRLWCRRITRTKVFLDDYLMIVALVFEYGITVAGVVLLYNGLGTHIIYVSPEQLVVYMKTLSTGTFLYTLCITFVKLSILALYKRIFSIRPMMQASNVVACIVILWCFGVCLIGAVTCMPFKKLWEPNLPGGCINLAQFYYGLQIPNILTDAIILVLPMKAVWNLQVPRSQKVMLSGIFLIGTTTLAFDIVRLVVMVQLSEAGGDITYDQVTASVWTCIEPMMGITAACLSNMRPLFVMLPR
ncbi:integral membrane protein, partial [Aspergillus japonicus CBS 114.51]